jgi:hypothetical protein
MNPKHLQSPHHPWTAGELEEVWLLHQRLLNSRACERHERLLVQTGGHDVSWNLEETVRVRVNLDDSATGIVVRPEKEGIPLAIHPIFRKEDGTPQGTPMTYPLGRGRYLVFRCLEAYTHIEIEYRESLYGSLAAFVSKPSTPALRALRSTFRPDFCLADLRFHELRNPATWQALLVGFIFIPALVAGAVALVLSAAGVHPSTVLFGVIASAIIAETGTIACGTATSFVAASTGGIPISVALGITYAFLLKSEGGVGQAGAILSRGSPVFLGLGGLPAVIYPSLSSVALVAAAVGFLSLAMGWVRHLAGERRRDSRRALGVIMAIAVSAAGPGVILGISKLSGQGRGAEIVFGLGLALVGGTAFGAAAGVRSRRARRGVIFGLCYGLLTSLVALIGDQLADPTWSLLFATTFNHILLQGTFFSLAYVLGERAGGPRGGTVASSVEGIGGYVGFLLSRPGFWS